MENLDRALAQLAAEDCEEPTSTGFRIAPNTTEYDDEDLMLSDQPLTQQPQSEEVDFLFKKRENIFDNVFFST